MYSDVLSAQKKECASLLDLSDELRNQFSGDSPYHHVTFKDYFEDNRHQWPVGAKDFKYKKNNRVKTLTDTIKIKKNRLVIDKERERWVILTGGLLRNLKHYTYYIGSTEKKGYKGYALDSRNDFLIETCFKINKMDKKDGFGLSWGSRDDGEKGHSFLINVFSGEYAYVLDKDRTPKTKTTWKKSTAIRKNKQYNTLSVLKSDNHYELYINGQLVSEKVYWNRIGLSLGFRWWYGDPSKVEISHLTVLEAPKLKLPSLSDEKVRSIVKKRSGDDILIPIENAVLDLRTNLIWFNQGAMSNGYSGKTFGTSKNTAKLWIERINFEGVSGFSNWSIPSLTEYKTIFKKNAGPSIKYWHNDFKQSFILGYMPPIRGLRHLAWTLETENNQNILFDFNDGKKSVFAKDDEESISRISDVLAVRQGPFDLAAALEKKKSQTAIQLSDQQQKIFERVMAAYKTGLEDSGALLFDALLNQASDELFANNYTRVIVNKGLPLKLAGKLLLAVHDKEKNNPVFWYEYAHLAGLANQPALVLQGAKQLMKIGYTGEFKQEVQDQAAVFEALGYMLLGQEDKAYGSLLMRLDLKDNLFVPSYLNQFAIPLLKDKSKLATLIGFDEQMLSGTYAVPKPQAFYNIETGKLIEPVEASPEMIKTDAQPIQEEKTPIETKTIGATVLD
jgi:hypothetical protein